MVTSLRIQKEKVCVRVYMLLDFKLLLPLEQSLFCPRVMSYFFFFLSFSFRDREAPVNMVLRGEYLVKVTIVKYLVRLRSGQ